MTLLAARTSLLAVSATRRDVGRLMTHSSAQITMLVSVVYAAVAGACAGAHGCKGPAAAQAGVGSGQAKQLITVPGSLVPGRQFY